MQENKVDMKKTLVFYINSIHDGGAERVMVNLTKRFADAGYKVVLVTSFRDTWEYEVATNVIRVTLEENESCENVVTKNIKRILGLRQVCRNERASVLISFMREPNTRSILATIGLKTKTVISVRNDPKIEYGGFLGHFIARFLLPLADGAVFQTEDERKWFGNKLRNKSKVIYNIVADRFYKTHYAGGEGIVSFGRIAPQKNHQLLIRAFAKLHEKHPDEKLYIYGKKDGQELDDLIEMLDLKDAVLMPGRKNDVESILENSKLFVLSSDFEGMPNALMEAMAVGIPCISTDCLGGGPRELFGDMLSEYLVPINDVNALAQKIILLVENENLRHENGEKMKHRAEDFRPEAIIKQWIDYIDKFC